LTVTLRIFMALLWLPQPGAAQNPATPRKHDEAIQALQDIRARVATLQRELERADSQESDASDSLRNRTGRSRMPPLSRVRAREGGHRQSAEVRQAELASLTRERGLHRRALAGW
jgi:hypothetical protein